MRVSCPTCQTEYDVPDAALAGRTRTLRCATCGNQWQAGPLPEETPAAMPPPPPLPAQTASAAELEFMNRPRATTETIAPSRPAPIPPYPPSSPPKRSMPVAPYEDPVEARNQADRESFASLVEAARQNKHDDEPVKPTKARNPPNPWLISILILLLIIAVLWLERVNIMHAWPPSTRVYNAISNALR
jgi:predicted Zn finger-like uncharacterized protein